MPGTYGSTPPHLSLGYLIMPANFTKMLFAFLTASIVSASLMVHGTEGHLSVVMKRLLCYGKYSEPDLYLISRLYAVPKRWFAHFYVVALFVTSFALSLTVFTYFYNCEMPHYVHLILDALLGSSRTPMVSPESTLIAIILLHVQSWKRFYETHYVSVFSDARMNLSHYAAGFIHYIGTTSCIVGESYGFVRDSSGTFHWHELKMLHFISSIIFLMASYEQLKTNIILANLRKDENGIVVTKIYKIPYGRLFEYISAPLQFTEIIMYLMLTIILWEGSSFHYVFIWVLVNQIETAWTSHRWARRTFVQYPEQRKICIPFLF